MYEKKKKLYFYLIIGIFIIMIGSAVTIFLTKLSFDLKLTLLAIVLLVTLLLLLSFKNKLDFYTMIVSYNKLISLKKDKRKTNIKLYTTDWYSNIKKNGFTIFRSFTNFDIYYKFENVGSKSKRQKTAIILVTIKTDISFEDKAIVDQIHKFEDTFYKKERFGHHIILQFKKTDVLSETNMESVENILFSKQNKNHYIILINCLYSEKSNEIYFIHSDEFTPNYFYTYAVEEIKKII